MGFKRSYFLSELNFASNTEKKKKREREISGKVNGLIKE